MLSLVGFSQRDHTKTDGATRCGPFFVVYNVLEQISVDREVDIFTTTRQLQVRRPEFVSTLVKCPLGYFGKGCTEHCSGHCIKGEPCDHISGECTNGCQDGYTGVRCSDYDRFQNAHVDATIVYSEGSYEKTEKSPPSNKNIPVRNLKDHIANLSSNDCAGFKSEYEIRVDYYWPDVSKELKGGTLIIKHIKETTYAEYTVRQLKIHNQTTRADRHVTIFNYTAPSYQEAPDPLSLVLFHRHVMKATANTAGRYTVVHCSSGVGRTGTYIALDALYREGEKTGKINVPMYVRTMRKDRMNMIHRDEQYKLLYHALMEAFGGPSRCMATEKFVEAYQEQTCHANCRDVVQNISQSSEFESYLEMDSLISAQYPIPDNTEDFLRLIYDYGASVVVFLGPINDIESGFIETDACITVIDCPTWEEGKGTTDKRVLLDVIKAVKTEKSDQEGRIIVLSSDGATRCGPFCVVYNVLEQISVDREVDIFTSTRQLQVRRPEFVSTLDEYQLCHDAVAEYLINDRVMETVTCKEKK
uniref:Receptor-type tyrosine-protein phosphatase U n=1 Tax=Magallana gigas TaxID=29159 RepID=K1PK35_MAGGI